MFVIATLILNTGIDPVAVVEYSIVFSIVILPLIVASNRDVMGPFVHGWLTKTPGWFCLVVISVAALRATPLLVLTSGGKG
jgi:manganese transport protein